MNIDDLLFEPIKGEPQKLKSVCASCQKIFEMVAGSGDQYCSECRHHNWSACSQDDDCCGGACG